MNYVIAAVIVVVAVVAAIAFAVSRHCNAHEVIRVLYRQCARWAVAAQQDESEIIRVLHANYATGYLWALKDIANSQDFRKATGEDFMRFEKRIVAIQDDATRRLVTKCRDTAPTMDDVMLKAIYAK
jgi:hypothetical protein